jgi:hypothetical protein
VVRHRRAPRRGLLLDPHRRERLLDVLEVQQEAEQQLVAQDRLARDDERERELDRVVEREGVDGWWRMSKLDFIQG